MRYFTINLSEFLKWRVLFLQCITLEAKFTNPLGSEYNETDVSLATNCCFNREWLISANFAIGMGNRTHELQVDRRTLYHCATIDLQI